MSDNLRTSGSLRVRLTVTLIAGATLLTVLLFLLVHSYAARIAQQGQDEVLEASVTSILDAAVIRDGVVEIDFPYASLSMLSTPADDRIFYAIRQDSEFLSGYPDLPIDMTADAGTTSHITAVMSNTTMRIATSSRMLIGQNTSTIIRVAVAQTQDSLSVTLAGIARNVTLFGAAFFILAVAMSFRVTASTIGPLQRLTGSVTRRGPQDLRPVEGPVPTEMAPLVSSLNSLMQRLDQSLTQSEDFIAEAAHRVRTPLATVRTYAETTLQRVEKEENRQAMRAMIRAIDESSRAAGQLLDHAMITFRADHLECRPLDLADLVTELVQGLTPVADMKDIGLFVHGAPSMPYSGDPILLQNALRNLVDNALKYAPGDSRIDILMHNSPEISIQVCDQGPGFPPDEISKLSERFTRGCNAEGTIGSGLGLTIAQDVAQAHGGTLHLGNKPEGGACVTLFL